MFLGALQPSPVSKNVQTPVLPRESFLFQIFQTQKKEKHLPSLSMNLLTLGALQPTRTNIKTFRALQPTVSGLSSPQCLGSPAHSGRALQPTVEGLSSPQTPDEGLSSPQCPMELQHFWPPVLCGLPAHGASLATVLLYRSDW